MDIVSCTRTCLNTVFSGAARLSQVVLFALTLIIFYDVGMRYFFNNPTFWALEISEYMLVFMGFAGIAEVQAQKKHIVMGFFYAKLYPGVRLFLDTLFHLCLVAFSLLLFWHSLKMTMIAYSYSSISSSLLATPLFIPYSIIPLAMLLLLLQGIIDIVEDIGLIKVSMVKVKQ